MDHTLLRDAPDRNVFDVCVFFTANSYMFIYSYVTYIRLYYSDLRLSKLVKGKVLENLFCTSVNNLCTIKQFEKKKYLSTYQPPQLANPYPDP